MAASIGEMTTTYTRPPPAASSSSCFFPPDDEDGLVMVRNDCAASTMLSNFLMPPVADDDHYFPADHSYYYCYSPQPQVFAENNEMNMTTFVDHGRSRRASAVAAGRTGHHHHGNRPSSTSRIGFRTRSEVDVLDDGFRWRKYGKKAVKSSPNPRNYYRCSVEGCGVKKRVERDCDDPRYVVTTYDGVHNHAASVPGGAGGGGGGAAAGSSSYYRATPPPQQLLAVARLSAGDGLAAAYVGDAAAR